MRDASLAGRLRVAFDRCNYVTTWAAALPEAIHALDHHFPSAVACTLHGRTPSLIDLETLLAYQVLGHAFVSLPQTPVWALTRRVTEYAPGIEALRLPIQLVPEETGAEAFADEIAHALRHHATRARAASAGAPEVLLALGRADEGRYLARYLATCGITARTAAGPREALRRLRERPYQVLVSEEFNELRAGGSYWREIEERWRRTPVLLIVADRDRLAHLSPLALPSTTAGALCKPVAAGSLATSLRRLMRIVDVPLETDAWLAGHSA
jgi:hypothetical protein